MKILENNNYNIEDIIKKHEEEIEEEENEKRESDDEKDYEKEFDENNIKNTSKINITNNKNDNSHTNSNKTYSKYSNNYDDIKKQIRKPRIDTLEYNNIIKQYKNYSNDHSKILTTDNMNMNRSQSEKINSFRKKTINNSEDKVTIKKVDSKTNMVFDNDDNFIMALKGKRTGRSKKEIQDFMKRKQLQEKEDAIKIEQIEKKKILKNIMNLLNY